MATISGALRFDGARTAISSPALPGIANVPIVLQNTATNVMLAVLTDAGGNYMFINVPDGNYRIVEAFGTPASASPGDFSTAVAGNPVAAVTPPISFAANPPPEATNLDATTPNTLLITVNGADLINQDILNGPVEYTPIQTITDSTVVISPINLITQADNGTFGTFPQGTPANTGANPNPFPDIGSQFVYTLPNPVGVTPADGFYTIQNLMNDSTPNVQNTWWRVADHTTGNETGRMMIVNGFNPGAIFFQQTVPVAPNTFFLMSSWILNLSKSGGLVDPMLGVEVIGENGQVLLSATLGELIPRNDDAPQWKQIGTVFNSMNNTSVTLQFSSRGPAAFGNDYAIDDIALNEIQVPAYIPQKTASSAAVNVGDIVTYTVTLNVTGMNPLTNVMFIDAIPAGFAFVPGSVAVNGVSQPAFDPNTGFLTPDIPGGGMLTVTFEAVATSVPAVNPAMNNAHLNYSYSPVIGGVPSIFNTVSNNAAVQVMQADVAVAKTGNLSPVQAGNVLTYTVTVTNNGPNDAPNVTVTDAVPAGLTGAEFSVDGGATFQPWPGSLALGTLISGATATVLIRGTVSAGANGVLSNTVSVNSGGFDPVPGNNSSTVDTPVMTSADLSIVKTADLNPVGPGDVLTYTLTVTNNGPSDAQDVTLTDAVPASLTGVEFSTDGGATFQPFTGSVALGTLAAGAAVRILIRGTVSAAASGVIANMAVVNSPTPDPNPDNNSSTADTGVVTPDPTADLVITKTGNLNPVQAGSVLTYTLTVTNNGPNDAPGVTVTDAVAAGLTGAEFSIDGGLTFQPFTGTLALGMLANGATATVLIRGTVNSSASGAIANMAFVSGEITDPNPANNSSSVETTVITSADLSILKTGNLSPVQVGDVLTYTVAVTNNGPSDAQDVTLTDAVPAGLTGAEFSVDGGATFQPFTGSLALGTLVSGATATVLIRGTVSAGASGVLSNTASVSSPTPDPNPGNNSSTVDTPVITSADLSIVKTADLNPVQPGGVLTYTLTLTNNGPSDAQDVTVTDEIPPSLTGAEFSTDGGATFQPFTGSVALGTLAKGAAVSILLRGTVSAAASGVITNTAVVSSPTPDPVPGNNSSAVNTTVNTPSADLQLIKTANKNPVSTGDVLTYTIMITNNGPSDAQNVVLTDAAPSVLQGLQFSTDGGATFQPWLDTLALGTLVNGATVSILIRGTVGAGANRLISNAANVDSATPDPNLGNNNSTVNVLVTPTCDEAANQIISSIAMEELGLSHIFNAEGEKLQFALGTFPGSSGLNPTVSQVLELDNSVRQTLRSAVNMQVLLKGKLFKALVMCKEQDQGLTGITGPSN